MISHRIMLIKIQPTKTRQVRLSHAMSNAFCPSVFKYACLALKFLTPLPLRDTAFRLSLKTILYS